MDDIQAKKKIIKADSVLHGYHHCTGTVAGDWWRIRRLNLHPIRGGEPDF